MKKLLSIIILLSLTNLFAVDVTFTMNDGSWLNQDIEWKLSPTEWALVQMFDDGHYGRNHTITIGIVVAGAQDDGLLRTLYLGPAVAFLFQGRPTHEEQVGKLHWKGFCTVRQDDYVVASMLGVLPELLHYLLYPCFTGRIDDQQMIFGMNGSHSCSLSILKVHDPVYQNACSGRKCGEPCDYYEEDGPKPGSQWLGREITVSDGGDGYDTVPEAVEDGYITIVQAFEQEECYGVSNNTHARYGEQQA